MDCKNKTMKKLLLLSIILISLIGKAQDTTATFINDTIPYHVEIDTVLFESDIIIIDTIPLTREFYQDHKLLPWFIRKTVNINAQKYAVRYVQKGFKKYGTSNVIRFYRYRDVRYIRIPEKIKTKVEYNH